MNFIYINYLPLILIALAIFCATVILLEKKFFIFIKTYWFYRRSIVSYISTILFLAGMCLLLFSLLDIRGPAEKIKMAVPSDRTIILLDTSASMLAEDVSPSRLEKAVLIAKHFARKAAGHQISVVAFAEVQKKIVPFTSDLDLIDARLDSLKNLRNHYGSSALTVAIQESMQYFREARGEARGNILVLTDGEETAEGINLKVPESVRVAFIGVGTSQGGRIPLDDSRGLRFGYKKVRGRDVITKLNENFFEKLTADIPSSKFWTANSYSLPSEEVLTFFQSEKLKGKGEQDMTIRPVLMEWFVLPALFLLFISYFFKAIRVFVLGCLIVFLPVKAQEANEIELSPEILTRLDELQRGQLNQLEKIKLADDLQKSGANKEAVSLYSESLSDEVDSSLPPEAYLNYGTSLLESGNLQKALSVYQKLSTHLKGSEKSEKISEVMDKNVVSYFKQQEEKKKKEKENKKNQKNKDQQDKDNKQGGQSGEGQEKKSSSGSSQNNKDKKNDDKSDSKDNEKNNKDKNDNKNDQKKNGDDKDDSKSQDGKDGEDQSQPSDKPMPPKKLPAKLKQLMSDDRQLQMKMIENGTRDLNRRKSRKSKDW